MRDSTDLTLMLSDYPLDERLSRDFMNKVIIKELGNCRPLTTNVTVFKFMLEEFFGKYEDNITKLVDTMYIEYNPLDTKNIREEENDTYNEGEHRESQGDIHNTDTYTTGNTLNDTKNRTDEKTVSAYNASTYQPKEKDVTADTDLQTSETEHEGVTTSDIDSTVDTSKTTTDERIKTISGKDGDLTYQDLISKERELANFNIYNWIVSKMRKELFLLVY